MHLNGAAAWTGDRVACAMPTYMHTGYRDALISRLLADPPRRRGATPRERTLSPIQRHQTAARRSPRMARRQRAAIPVRRALNVARRHRTPSPAHRRSRGGLCGPCAWQGMPRRAFGGLAEAVSWAAQSDENVWFTRMVVLSHFDDLQSCSSDDAVGPCPFGVSDGLRAHVVDMCAVGGCCSKAHSKQRHAM